MLKTMTVIVRDATRSMMNALPKTSAGPPWKRAKKKATAKRGNPGKIGIDLPASADRPGTTTTAKTRTETAAVVASENLIKVADVTVTVITLTMTVKARSDDARIPM